ncbi:uncharacterized protein LOC129789281 isoform X2 [Lutzomyia longipalpis]|uniref:uncharacterized protein LOC129789281 isoform X2 n=1 Tax=Lutzomyia longipalpis TaxID=7200 RepID=UPI00248343BA|nr:uncharacterized protein LOC129789281 isoform X2 [Lutzomyia longipalpis]
MSMGKEMPSCPPAALRCFLPAAFRGNLDKNRIVPVSEIPAEYGAYRTTETTTVTSNKSTNLPSKIAWTPQKVPRRKHDVDSRAIRCTPDWSENAVAGDHLWVPTSVSGDCCYVGDNECVKHGPRMKCSACKIIAHANCIGILMERNKLSCKPTFRDVGIRQYREQTTTHHHWVHRRTEKGKCKQCGKSLQAKLSFGSKEIVALSCAWCKSSFHNKESCFNQHRIGEECSLGIHSSIIVPPSWIVKLPRKGSFKSSLRKSPRKKQVGKKKPKDREPRTFVIKPIPTANVTPVIVFINPKSGGNQGAKLLQKFQWLLNPRQVFDLTQGGPKMGLELFRKVPQLRILACGGDGTVGWVLSVLDQIGFTPPPAVGVLPLGTGNDLARSLGWGGGYTDEPIGKILANIGDSDTVLLDRWSLRVEPNPSAKSDSVDGKDELPLNVVNNYFSLGVDAHIALEFHEAREAHPEKFNSRLRNKMFYGQAGGKDLLKRKWKGLADFVTLECDGKDLTPKLRELKVHAIVFLNIPSYGGGTHPWNKSGGQYEPSTDDALIEVVGLTTYQLPLLQAGGHGSCITQCRSAKIVTSKTIPMQVDGEACKLKPSIIEINLLNKAVMLAKRKPGRINVQHSTLEPLNISINRITMSDYEQHHYDKDLLKQSATSIGYIEVNPIADLENVRTLVNRQCETAVESGVKLSSEWCFVDSCTAERFFRVDRAQEHLHYITDIANDALYILDQDCPTMPQTPEDETALASPSSLHQPPNTSPSESSEKDSRECTPLTPQKKFFNRSLSGPGPTTNLDNLSPTLNRMTYQSDSDNEVIRNGKTLETKTINFRSFHERLFSLNEDPFGFSNLLEKTTDVVIKAAKSGDLLLLKELHTQGYSLLSIDSTGQTALHYGAQYGHKDIVRFLISYAPNSIINMLDNERGQTALHMAAANKRRSICYMLVAAGANLDIQDNEGRTPKMLAILADDHNLATYLEMVCLMLVQPSDGFKLTASPSAGVSRADKTGTANTWRKNPRVRDVLQKVHLSTKLNRDDDDDNDAREDIGNEDDNDDDEKLEYRFEKVHHSNVKTKIQQDMPPKRMKKKVSKVESTQKDNYDDEDDEDDDKSLEAAWWNFYGVFSDKKSKFLSAMESVREAENQEILKEAPKSEPLNGNLWKSYLNRKPFNLIFNFDDDNDDDDEDNKKVKKEKEKQQDVKVTEKSKGPLSADDFEDLLLFLPSFVPNYTNVENIDCRRQGQIFQRQLRGQKLWAFQMLDATGKISSGLLQGNINQLGNYDLCTDIATRVKVTEKDSVRIQGKYCLASIELQAEDENLKLPLHLIQGKSLLRSSLADPNHFLPRFTIFNWGICVPAACSAADIEDFLDDTLEDYNATGVTVFVDLKDEDCYVKKKQDWNNLLKTEWQLTATIAGVCFVLVIATLATMNDWWIQWKRAAIVIEIVDGNDEDGKRGESVAIPPEEGNTEPLEMVNQVLMAFSMRQTLRDLVHLRDGEIGCIHGLKTIASLSIFLTLKTLQVVRLPWSNRIALTETLDNPATLPLRSPLLSMDLFLVLSGILVAYSMCTDFETYGRIRWIRRILGRVLRLLPLLALSTLFTAWIWPHLGSGPLWGDIIEENSDICQESSWKNFLFINNWGDIEKSCSPHTTQLAIEFQLFLLSPLVIWLMYRSPVMGLGLFGLLHAFSAATRFSDTQQNRLSPWIFHGMKLSQIHRTINLSFGSLLHRITPYMGGLGLGMMLHQTGRNVRLSDGIKYGGWASCLISFTWCFASQWDITRRDYVYDPTEMAKSTAWTPLIWTIAISWIVFACNSGNGGILSDILSSKPMIFMSRISYAMYFVEFIVLNTTAATVQHPDAFGLSDFLDWVEIGAIIACATALSLIFDLPMYSVKALLLNAAEAEDAQPATDSPAEAEQSDRATGEPEEEIEDIFGEQDEVKEKLPKRKIQFYAEENEDDEPEGHVGGGEATDDIWGIDERNEEFIPKRPSSYAKRYNYSKTPDEDNLGANEEDEAVDEEEEEEENGEEIEEEKEITRRSRRW